MLALGKEPTREKTIKENQGENLPSQSLELGKALEPKLILNASIPEVDKDWGNKLWDAIKTSQGQKGSLDADHQLKRLILIKRHWSLK